MPYAQDDNFADPRPEETGPHSLIAQIRNAARSGRRSALPRSVGLCLIGALALCAGLCAPAVAQNKVLPGHRPALIARSQLVGRTPGTETIHLAFSLPLRQQAELTQLLARLYDPGDPQYSHYLTPEQFTTQFGPSQDDYQAVAAFAEAHGLRVTQRHPNRTALDAQGTASAVEAAFGVHLMQYRAPSGRVFRAPDAEPSLPADIASRLAGIVGLDDAAVRSPQVHARPKDPAYQPKAQSYYGSGPYGFLSPNDVQIAYNTSGTGLTGIGQTLAVVEFDGYYASDIANFEAKFNLPNTPLENVLVDGFNGHPVIPDNQTEVTLDIELMIGMAPGASRILVYEAPWTGYSPLDVYNRIANDNLAKIVSISWAGPEDETPSSYLNAEFSAFEQMAAQGQSIFAAAGDSGAYNGGSSLNVNDPPSQPYVTGVGGTILNLAYYTEAYISETSWNDPSFGMGGGGISGHWLLPAYQEGVISASSLGSTTYRNVPDVALNADDGYAIYLNGQWTGVGGTSCGAPLWAAFTALVNQKRVAMGLGNLGFANPALYAVGAGQDYARDFHDIADGSANGYYPAVTGYDLSTGWGSFNGANLLQDLTGGVHRLFWQNDVTGQLYFWDMSFAANTPTLTTDGVFGPASLPLVWRLAGAADFNGDGAPDLVWENSQTGDVTWWPMSYANGTPTLLNGGGYIAREVPAAWSIVGIADFNGDGTPDILWRNAQTGDVYWWQMAYQNGALTAVNGGYVYRGVGLEWRIAGVGDFNGDGTPDILWRNAQTGDVYWWQMGFQNGALAPVNGAYVAYGIGLEWQVTSVRDLNGDGIADILWRNMETGDVYWWQMGFQNDLPIPTEGGYITQGVALQWLISSVY